MTTLADLYLARLRALGVRPESLEIAFIRGAFPSAYSNPALVRLVGAWVR